MMPTSQSPKSAGRRARKSIAHVPSITDADRENNTVQGISEKTRAQNAKSKKTRSKSLGPGGLDALIETDGNRQKVAPFIKSILKPTTPISPPKPIPPHKYTPAKSQAAATGNGETEPVEDAIESRPVVDLVAVNATEEQSALRQQAKDAAREQEKREILERRDARRKSLANRRVSFAPEATLHTWDIVELPEDATNSSEATNSTRRASTGSTLQSTSFAPGQFHALGSDIPSTPRESEVQVAASPAHQRDLHQKKRRRSSTIAPIHNQNGDLLSSSPIGSAASDDTQPSPSASDGTNVSESDSDEDRNTVREGTISGVLNEDLTAHSERSFSTDSSTRLDNSLRQATHHAAASNMPQDQTGDISMDLMDEDVPDAPIAVPHQDGMGPLLIESLTPRNYQENVNPFSPAFGSQARTLNLDVHQGEMTMEMTQAVGAIIPSEESEKKSPDRGRRRSMSASRRRSSVGRRRSSGSASILDDETMEFATTYGGIEQQPQKYLNNASASGDEDEEMTMELTTVIGGVVDPHVMNQAQINDTSIFDMDMDITTAVGRVLSPVTERTEPSEDGTAGMDITRAVGAILPDELKVTDKPTAKMLMEEEAEHGQLTRFPFSQTTNTPKMTPTTPKAIKSTDAGSPQAIAPRSATVKSSSKLKPSSTPTKIPGTPSKQLTPQPARPTTPSKTPPSKNVSMRKTSPKKLFKAEIKKSASKSPKTATPNLKFSKDIKTGHPIPDIVLTPTAQRRTSGIGIDQEGIGSPRVAAILDRRASIVDSTVAFALQELGNRGVRFENPTILEQEINNDRADEERRESGRGILQAETEGSQGGETGDLTSNLKDMIQSLTPKKNRFKGRKSLAGSAKGLLGKRPIELDEEDEEDSTPKRLRRKEKSPVKRIHLPGPLLMDEKANRLGKAPKFALNSVSGNVSTPVTESPPGKTVSTPKNHERYKDVQSVKIGITPPPSYNEQMAGAAPEAEPVEEAPISLQDFLNMTNVRFMDLTTTKRRHTIAPSNGRAAEDGSDSNVHLADCVAAGACTIPVLELFQHSCRELKKYISDGRSVVREIEKDTLEDNPPLFREYMSAVPEVRAIMDNQFKNIKAHARGESKRTWYEWRSKLFEGLKKGLVGIHDGMVADERLLAEQESILQPVVPDLIEKHAALKGKAETLQAQADEVANCDQEELQAARSRLVAKHEEVEAKKKLLADLQAQMQEKDQNIDHVTERTAECQAEIQEAERVASENRGWTYAEVKALKDKVDELERTTGWKIETCTATHVTYSYRNTLFLYAAPDHQTRPVSLTPSLPISLTYSPPEGLYRRSSSGEVPIIHRFFTQLLQARLFTLAHAKPQPLMKSFLNLISSGWDLASRLYDETAWVRRGFATDEKIVADDTLLVQSMILLRAPSGVRRAQTKALVQFHVRVGGEGTELRWEVDVKTPVVYGELFFEEKMRKVVVGAVEKKEEKRGVGIGGWKQACEELKGRMARKEVKSRGEWRSSGAG